MLQWNNKSEKASRSKIFTNQYNSKILLNEPYVDTLYMPWVPENK